MSNSEDSSSDGDYYGPALPPNLSSKSSDSSVKVIGPELPPGLRRTLSSSSNQDQTTSPVDESNYISKDEASVQIGPALPPAFRALLEGAAQVHSNSNNDTQQRFKYGDESSSDSDSEIIGPLPPDHPKALIAGGRRELNSTSSKNKPRKKLQREEWMLIPPSNKNVTELGLGPRKFLQRAPEQPVMEGDDAEQIDSDEEFERRTRAEMDQQIIDEYDKKMEDLKDKVEVGKRKSGSLLEIHQRELKEKKVKSSEPKERRPFDRNTDLSVTGLSGEDKHKYIEKSRELNTRFKAGRQKFL